MVSPVESNSVPGGRVMIRPMAQDRGAIPARVTMPSSGGDGGATPHVRYPVIDAIRRGEAVEARTHASVLSDDHVLQIRRFCLWYGAAQALHSIDMPVARGRVTALIGPSGCGKSTLLRSVNRLNDLIDGVHVKGEMILNGRPVYAHDVDVIDLRKRMGMVFQKPNPFPMSIYENVVYPLRIDGENRRSVLDAACERSLKAAAIWDEVKDRLTQSALGLSGGQQQRLCIARAIAVSPAVLLMDEPCSALDPISTLAIEDLMGELKKDYTIVIVTHNMQQAARESDQTAFFNLEGVGQPGQLVEINDTETMFTHPAKKETEDYISGRFG